LPWHSRPRTWSGRIANSQLWKNSRLPDDYDDSIPGLVTWGALPWSMSKVQAWQRSLRKSDEYLHRLPS
jgi:hypothetical protein